MIENACTCKECRAACEHAPGWFKPGEAEKAASLKGLTLKEFFDRYLVIDYWAGEELYVLKPATIDDHPGGMSKSDPRGRCIFYNAEGLCDVHETKPHECRAMHHSTKATIEGHHEVAKTWADNPQAAELLGRKPDQGDYTFMDALSMLMPYGTR